MEGVAPLDNAHPDAPKRSPLTEVGDAAMRAAYARAFVSFLFKHVGRPPGDAAEEERCVADFLSGMELGLRDAKVVAKRLEEQRGAGFPVVNSQPADLREASRSTLASFITNVTSIT